MRIVLDHILEQYRQREMVRQVKVVETFRYPFRRTGHARCLFKARLGIADAPPVKRIERPRGLEAEAGTKEVHPLTADIAIAVAAENGHFRVQLLINADAPSGSVLAGAV